MDILRHLSTTDIVAWWGAIVATVVLLWDIYKWLATGPRVRISVSANMRFLGDPVRQGKMYVTIRATNRGDRPTTITNLGFTYYSSPARRLLNRPDQAFVVSNPGVPHPIPYVLHPGSVWDGAAVQDSEVETMGRSGYLFCNLYHSASGRLVQKRVKFRAKQPNT